jgi:hypothetical protein
VKKLFINTQLDVIDHCKIYLNKIKKDFFISANPFFYFTTWADTVGRVKLMSIIKEFKFKYLRTILKNIFFLGKNYDLIPVYSKNFFRNKYSHVIISYSTIDNFDSYGFFYDKFFNISSKEHKNFCWFLVSLDHKTPDIIRDNIIIFKKKNINSFSYIYIFKYLITVIFSKKYTIFNLFYFWNVENNFSEIISKAFQFFFKNNINIKNVILNYEAIPFQNFLIETIKCINNNIKTYGYLHCAPWPLQTDLLYKGEKLDQLFVSGEDQKSVLIKYLGWNKKKISVIPSLRFYKENQKQFNGYIFIPYNLNKDNNFINKFSKYLDSLSNKSLPFFKIRVHPLNKKSKVHLDFINRLKILLNEKKKKFFKKKYNLSIFFGSPTGVCMQALEEGTDIIHFPEDMIFDAFSSKIWENINVENINKDILKYSIKKKGRILKLTYEKNKFNKYLIRPIKNNVI